MKVALVVGARPNFVKHAMVSRALRDKHQEILIHTGQHYDIQLNKIFFDQLEIVEPHYNLEIGSGTHAEQTGQMMIGTEKVLQKEKPDWILVYGDTNSTLAGALAAAKLNIPIAHVEAGLRAYNKQIPEEVNRVVTDYLSSLLFAPTETAVENLKKENITAGVHNTGDVMYDAILHYKMVADKKSEIMTLLNLTPGEFIVSTIHRAETTDNPEKLRSVMTAFAQIDDPIIFPIHPRTKKALKTMNLSPLKGNHVKLIDPVGYLDMMMLLKNARLLITDSGGLQKEAYFLKTPCLTCLKEDEWPETTAAGANKLVSADTEKIVAFAKESYPAIKDADEFGDGHAAEKMVSFMEESIKT